MFLRETNTYTIKAVINTNEIVKHIKFSIGLYLKTIEFDPSVIGIAISPRQSTISTFSPFTYAFHCSLNGTLKKANFFSSTFKLQLNCLDEYSKLVQVSDK